MLSVPQWTQKYSSSTTDPHHITGQGFSNNRLLQGGRHKSSVANLPPAYLMQISKPKYATFWSVGLVLKCHSNIDNSFCLLEGLSARLDTLLALSWSSGIWERKLVKIDETGLQQNPRGAKYYWMACENSIKFMPNHFQHMKRIPKAKHMNPSFPELSNFCPSFDSFPCTVNPQFPNDQEKTDTTNPELVTEVSMQIMCWWSGSGLLSWLKLYHYQLCNYIEAYILKM